MSINRSELAFNNLQGQKEFKYERGLWTPEITFATPGDVSVAYSTQRGFYVRMGMLCWIEFVIVTTTSFTWSTASGNLQVTNLPYTSYGDTNTYGAGTVYAYSNINRTNFTQLGAFANPDSTYIAFSIDGIGQGHDNVKATDMTSGTATTLGASFFYPIKE